MHFLTLISLTQKQERRNWLHRERISFGVGMLKWSPYELTKFKPRTDKYSLDEILVSAQHSANTFSL
jgi:hypothetical protein